jgi:hypothetical protein
MNKYSQLFAILKKNDLTKEEVVEWFTDGRTTSLTALSDGQYKELLRRLQGHNGVPPGDQQRKKLIGIAKSMNWGTNTKAILKRLDDWCLNQKYKKKLMAHNQAELGLLVTIFETKVYPDYLRALNK